MKKNMGYTLVELIVVIAILSIILIMTIPNTGYFKALAEKAELKEFKRDLLFARNKAIIDSNTHTIKFMYEDNGYKIVTDVLSSSLKVKYFKSGLRLNNKNDLSEISFLPNGTTSNSGTIHFSDRNDKKYKLTVTPVRGLIDIKRID